ncbi:MAG: DUF5672 family protein [Bacteroidota bacterium]
MKFGSVIVETRALPDLVEIINNHLKFIPKHWGLTIFHGEENEAVLKQAFPFATFNRLLVDWKPKSYCNDTMTSLDFWNGLYYDKVLVFQSDSMILRNGIYEFLEYDYIGSPWQHLEIGGNGGFSIRDKAKTLALLNKKPYTFELHGNEDEYFSKYLHEVGGKVAPREMCLKFGCESIFTLGTFGYHAIDKHLTPAECEQIINQYK